MAGYQTAFDAYQAGQAAALQNLLRGLSVQQQQSQLNGMDIGGNAAKALAAPNMPPASGMNAPDALFGDGAPPNLTPAPNPPPVTQVPMPGAAPMSTGPIPPPPSPDQMPAAPQGASIPPISASQLQPPGQGGGAPPMAPMPQSAAPQGAPAGQGPASAPQGAPAGQGPASAPQAGQTGQGAQNPWWKTMAAQIKQQNPNASGRDVMAALNAMQSVMNQQNKQDFENLKLNMQNQQKEDSLAERERNDEARNKAYQENADTNRQRADTYDKAVDERNSRALDNIKIKLDAAKAKNKNAANDPAYRSLETQYKQVSQDTRAAQALGSQATPAQKFALDQRLNDLSAKMDAYQRAPESSAPSMSGSAHPAGGDTVNVISPDGTPGSIPAAQLDDAIKAGYKKAP